MKLLVVFAAVFLWNMTSYGGTVSSVSGSIVDTDQAAVSGAQVELLTASGKVLKETKSGATGEFSFFPVEFGTYTVRVHSSGFADYQTQSDVASSAPSRLTVTLMPSKGKELVINVKAKRNLVPSSASGSLRELSREDIEARPQGNQISLPKLLAETTPGIVQGPFGQMFIRGNHANIQYQIDGVQLPDSGSSTFGDSFSPRNIDHMETITGGIPAEYGERLAAVVNIITKSGPEKPGGDVDVMYGSYNTISPQAVVGGSNASGHLHYFGSFDYMQTDRGLDTPEPQSYADQKHGGSDAVHDHAHSHEEFIRLDDIVDNENKLTLTMFNSNRFYEIPNFPSSFKSTDPYFQAGYSDQFGNGGDPTATTFNYVPSNTNDTQSEQNSYVEFVWKRTLSDSSFLQVAPYFKYSSLKVTNDPANDLITSAGGASPIVGSQPSSFALDRFTNNVGLKTDYTWRINDQHLFKTGFQAQNSYSRTRNLSIQTDLATAPFTDQGSDSGNLEAVYVQDSYSPMKKLTFNLGLRATATQFKSDDVSAHDGLLQPRLGVEYFATETTKLHAFYGKLFQPAPFENLRKAFTGTGNGQLTPYDVKAEKDDYYEVGVSQQLGEKQVATVNYYYKHAKDMMDDAQLLNTSIAQPYNFAQGYATGIEFSLSGEIARHLTEFFNYSYEDARGKGISGGIFAFKDPSNYPSDQYQFLDHVQLNTANLGLTYTREAWWTTVQGLYGSGLRTGPNNGASLPSHVSFDYTAGYKFKTANWSDGIKLSFDILNITDNRYPITVANGFNGSHYAAEREFFVHIGKDF